MPTCRPESFVPFLEAWGPLFEKHLDRLIVVQDLDGHDPQIEKAVSGCFYDVELHHRGTLAGKLIPTGTDMIRSHGIYQAWRAGSEYTITLDDDVRPHGDPFAAYEEVFDQGAVVSPYLDVGALTTFNGQLRGFPFKDRVRQEVAIQYGGWHGVLDYDAPTQLEGVNAQEWFEPLVVPVPRGAAVTGCIMNAAWRTKYAPIMWQLPMLTLHRWEFLCDVDEYKCVLCGARKTCGVQTEQEFIDRECVGRFNRFGDIWAGLFAKKVCDALGVAMVINGAASVRHERASDPAKNMERERTGIPVNEDLWDALWTETGTLEYAYRTVTDSAIEYFQRTDMEYARHFSLARDEWLGLFA